MPVQPRVTFEVWAFVANGAAPAGRNTFQGTTTITTYSGAPQTRKPDGSYWTAADMADLQLGMNAGNTGSGNGSARFYEAYADVLYAEQPTVAVTGPADPVTNTTKPIVTWDYTAGTDGTSQYAFQVRVFTLAVATGGGFDPATATAAAESGQTLSSAESWQATTALENGETYRAYVRVAQNVNGGHWSDWDYAEFGITVTDPPAPTLTVTAENAEGRIRLDVVSGGSPVADFFEVQRSTDGGTTWATVRTRSDDRIEAAGGVAVAWDYETDNGQSAVYRARAIDYIAPDDIIGPWSASSTPTAWTSTDFWIKAPTEPRLNLAVTVVSQADLDRRKPQGRFDPLGRGLPIVVEDIRGTGRDGTISILTVNAAERAALDRLLAHSGTFLMQAPAAADWGSRYVRIGADNRHRVADRSWVAERIETFAFIEVDSPTQDVVGWGATYAELAAASYASYTQLSAAFDDYNELTAWVP